MKAKILLLGLILIINSIFVLAYEAPTFDGISFRINDGTQEIEYPEGVKPTVYTNQAIFADAINPYTETGGNLDWIYSWYVNGNFVGNNNFNLASTYYKKGDIVKVEIKLYDRISDSYSEVKTRSLSIKNSKPVITSITSNQPSTDDDVRFSVNVQDADNDDLRINYGFSGAYNTDWQYMECNNGCGLTVPSSETQTGKTITLTATVSETVSEVNGNTLSKSVKINGAPVIDDFNPEELTMNKDIGESVSFSVTAYDPESQPLTYKWYVDNVKKSGVSTYSYTVTSGTYHIVKVIVSDSVSSVSKQWTVNVNPNPKPTAKIDYPAADMTININNPIDFQGSGQDDGSITAYSWNFGNGATSTEQNPSYTYTSAGTYTVRFKVKDNDNDWSNEKTRTITVEIPPGPNNAPVINSYSPSDSTPRILLTETQEFSITASDPNGDTITKTWYVDNSQVTTGDSYTYTATETGNYEIKFVVSDGSLTAQRTWDLRVASSQYDGLLTISDLDVKVDTKTDTNVNNGDLVSKDAKPGSKVQLIFKIKNEHDQDIEDISIEAKLRAIDDGEDVEEESRDFNVKAGKTSSKKTITLDIPYKVDEGTYNLDIHIEGDDEDHNVFEIDWTLKLHVDKEKHEVIIHRAELGSETLECIKHTSLNVEVLNIGNNEEDNVKLEIFNSELGIDYVKENIELTDDPFDDESSYKKNIRINADNVNEETYLITVNVYRDNKLEDTEIVNLNVGKCDLPQITEDKDMEITKVSMKVIEEVEDEMILPLILGIVVVLVLIVVSLYFGFWKR